MYYCFLVFGRIGEYISLDLFYLVLRSVLSCFEDQQGVMQGKLDFYHRAGEKRKKSETEWQPAF